MTFCRPPIIARTICGGISSRPGIWSKRPVPNFSKVSRVRSTTATASGPGRVDLDEAHLRGGRLGGDQLEEGLERLLASAPRRRRACSACSITSTVGCDQRLGRGQEALLLVGEVAVEGAAGDPGELDQVGDRGRLVALLGDRRDHRGEEPFALVALRLVARHAATRAHHPLPQLSRVPPRRPHHRGGP